MTYSDAVCFLRNNGIRDAEIDGAYLFRFVQQSDASLTVMPDETVPDEKIRPLLKRRADGEPLQYLLGVWDFFRQKYIVNENCLIPRSDTEILVEKAIAEIPQGARVADLCAGSGCIGISLCAERSDLCVVAWEKYPKTLDVACQNAALNGVADRWQIECRDVLTDAPDFEVSAVLCNPPYIPSAVVPTLSREVRREPTVALDGGTDGLNFYRAVIPKWLPHLKKRGVFYFEIGYDQRKSVSALGHAYGLTVQCFKDYGGNDRVIKMTKE